MSVGAAPTAEAGSRPNFLICIADDWGYPDASAYGTPAVATPGFDRVAADGVLFENAFTTAPSCTPSRNALLTGQHHWRLGQGIQLWSTLDRRYAVFPQLLRDAGYKIGHWRKAWGPGDWQAEGRKRHPFGKQTEGFADFLSHLDTGRPFCFTLGAYDPHRPYDEGSGARSGIDVEAVRTPADLPDHPVTRGDIADYFAEVQRFDSDVAAALSLLEKRGLRENTVVIVTGDHGMPFPRHKATLYDSGTRVPLAICWPAGMPKGRRLTDLVSFADIAPTLLEIAGEAIPAETTGRSLLPLLAAEESGRIDDRRDRVFTGLERHGQTQEDPNPGGYPCRAIRTDRFLYIHNFHPDRWPGGAPSAEQSYNGRPLGSCDDGPTKRLLMEQRNDEAIAKFYDLAFAKRPRRELYDLASDPGQVTNVADQPRYAEAVERLETELFEYLRATGDPRVGDNPEALDAIPYRGYRKRPERPKVSSHRRPTAGRRLVRLGEPGGDAWLVDGKAAVRLVDGRTLSTDNPRYELSTSEVGDAAKEYRYSDRDGLLDISLRVTLLDEESATLQLRCENVGGEPLRIDRIDFFSGRLTAEHDGVNRQQLLNGFVLGAPSRTFRPAGKTSVSSYETMALKSPPLTAGWLTGKRNFNRFTASNLDGKPIVTAWADCDGVLLPSGESRDSDLLFLSVNDRPLAELERFASLAGEVNHVKIWPPRIAWCTWYAGWQRKTLNSFRDGMERGIETIIPLIGEHFASRGANTVRICDDYIDYGDWSNKTFAVPRGFDRLAGMIDEAGLEPGVWYAPYWAEETSETLAEHPDWFAQNKSGEIWYETGWQPTSRAAGKFAVFDTSHPEVAQYFEDTAREMKRRGFRYVSTDFLNWSIMPDKYYDPTMTKAEVLRAGLEAIKRGLGPEVFYRAINNPLGVAMGLADDTRISGDSHGDNPTAYLRVAEVWFYNRRVWLNDPSAIVCQRWGKKTPVEWARMWMSWMAVAGTVLTYGDTLDDLPEEYMDIYRRVFPNLPTAGRPVDIWDSEPYLVWGMAPGEADGPYDVFGVFEIRGERSVAVTLNLDAVSARARDLRSEPNRVPAEYLVWDFWNQRLLETHAERLVVQRPVRGGQLYALRPAMGRPQLLGTSGHFSCGLIETRGIEWNGGEMTLSGQARGNGNDATVLFVHVPEGCQSLTAGRTAEGLTVRRHSESVLAIDVPASTEWLDWSIRFDGETSDPGDRPFAVGRASELASGGPQPVGRVAARRGDGSFRRIGGADEGAATLAPGR